MAHSLKKHRPKKRKRQGSRDPWRLIVDMPRSPGRAINRRGLRQGFSLRRPPIHIPHQRPAPGFIVRSAPALTLSFGLRLAPSASRLVRRRSDRGHDRKSALRLPASRVPLRNGTPSPDLLFGVPPIQPAVSPLRPPPGLRSRACDPSRPPESCMWRHSDFWSAPSTGWAGD